MPDVKLYPEVPENPYIADSVLYTLPEGWKRYELTNHLGNVLAVITDRKRGLAATGSDIQWYEADVMATQQYYPFGMLMPTSTDSSLRRQYSLNAYDYRYGFNGKEGDDEIKGDDNQQDYGMRIYDPRVGRFLSVDPIAREYPWYTPYQFAGNMPIWAVDLDGLEPSVAAQYKTNNEGLPILVTPAVDNVRLNNHPGNQLQIAPQNIGNARVSNQASIDIPTAEKERLIIAKYNAEVLKTVVADPQKLAQGDPVEWASTFFPALKLEKFGFKALKFLKYSKETEKLVETTGKLAKSEKEIITVLKEGQRTFGNAKKVAGELADLGDDTVDFISRAGTEKTNPFFNKVVGKSSADGKKYWRIDFDEVKGAHINWGNKTTGQKGAIPIGGGFDQVKRIIENKVID